jgi:hypothetical protein
MYLTWVKCCDIYGPYGFENHKGRMKAVIVEGKPPCVCD